MEPRVLAIVAAIGVSLVTTAGCFLIFGKTEAAAAAFSGRDCGVHKASGAQPSRLPGCSLVPRNHGNGLLAGGP